MSFTYNDIAEFFPGLKLARIFRLDSGKGQSSDKEDNIHHGTGGEDLQGGTKDGKQVVRQRPAEGLQNTRESGQADSP